jgi:hypothetical protein
MLRFYARLSKDQKPYIHLNATACTPEHEGMVYRLPLLRLLNWTT